jgi:hypothetical protein
MSNKFHVSDREWRKQQRKKRFNNKKRDLRKCNKDSFSKRNKDLNRYEDDDWESS